MKIKRQSKVGEGPRGSSPSSQKKRMRSNVLGCLGCGKCCKQVIFRVPKAEDSMLFWRLHNIEFYNDKANGMAVVVIHDKCEWLDGETLRCKNYEKRPKMCRDFLCDTARG